MATVTRQPFAPLNEARLQNLTSLKNRQNALSAPTGKRKAELIHCDDAENVDPLLSAKRSKASNSKDTILKPANHYVLTTKKPLASSFLKPSLPAKPRRTIQPKSQAKKLNGITKSSPLSAPAGRSPKRTGILSTRRRTARIDPPSLINAAAPFSLDAALKGTIPSYAPKREAEMKASWFFDIHEDTVEQEMTNMLQHGTCVLDISGVEVVREDKENVPPMDDVSQTVRRVEGEMVIEKERVSLGELNRREFFAEGCDEESIILVPADEDVAPQATIEIKEQVTADIKGEIDELMAQTESSSTTSALQPLEGTGESFELWESGSFKDEGESAVVSS